MQPLTTSSQIALQGLELFFEYSVGVYYYQIMDALAEIGATDMADVLESCKQVVFGDDDVPVNDFEQLEDFVYAEGFEEKREKLEAIEEDSRSIVDAFDARQTAYVLECVEEGLLTRKYE